MKKFWEKAVDLIYPPRCPVCDKILKPEEGRIHKTCSRQLERIAGAVCLHCGRPVGSEEVEYCFDCSNKLRGNRNAAFYQGKSLFLYKGQIKQTMYRFKYSNKREYAAFFAECAMEQWGEWLHRCEAEAVVAVPMFRRKKRKRGYNQAEVFAKALAEALGVPLGKHVVIRAKDTRPMKELNDAERKNNLRNAFQIDRNIVKYRKIMLVDDIYTTGSTADEVSRVLLEAGVEKIYFLSICMGQGL